MRERPANHSQSNEEPNELGVHVLQLKKAALVLRSINHPLRQRILQVLHQHAGLKVTELRIKLRLEQSVTSQHLATLRRAGVVRTERKGKYIHYFVHYERLAGLNALVKKLLT